MQAPRSRDSIVTGTGSLPRSGAYVRVFDVLGAEARMVIQFSWERRLRHCTWLKLPASRTY